MRPKRTELDIDLERLGEAVNFALRPDASLPEKLRRATGRLWEQVSLFYFSDGSGPESRPQSCAPAGTGNGAQSALAALVHRRDTREVSESENSMLLGEHSKSNGTWLG